MQNIEFDIFLCCFK